MTTYYAWEKKEDYLNIKFINYSNSQKKIGLTLDGFNTKNNITGTAFLNYSVLQNIALDRTK
jgi:hypothetical protein